MEKQNKQKVPKLISGLPLLSYLDSNQDKLIQSQMCYRYTIGQSVLFLLRDVSLHKVAFRFKNGCKSTTFFETDQIFFCPYAFYTA